MRGQRELILGLEGGGTRTVALLANAAGQIEQRLTFGPLNLKLATDRQIRAILRQFRPTRAAVCLAGCRTAADRQRVRALAQACWPGADVFVGNDLDSGHAAAFGPNGTGILAIAGTGSVVFGRNAAGKTARAGGWGHLLGDHGSAYWVAVRGLQAELRRFDHSGKTSRTLQRVLRQLALNTPDQLVDWIAGASKGEVAALRPLFTDRQLLAEAARLLAADIASVAGKLKVRHVVLAGGLAPTLHRLLPGTRLLDTETAVGALSLAGITARPESSHIPRPASLLLTEQRNPRTLDLDRQSVSQLVGTMLREEARVIPAIRQQRGAIVRAIKAIVRALRGGGRLFYVGAGTSGRLGVLDASECPPTFSTDPDQVQAIIAGGAPALTRAVEAAEDDREAGAAAIRARGVRCGDVVVGIAASGRTPFVLGALDAGRQIGARTFLLCFSPIDRRDAITIRTGPEVLTGSTRLKAGTATKLVLNMLTTIVMVRLGKVVGNLMVDVRPTNAKLRARAVRIVATLRGCDAEEARGRLQRAGWEIKRAVGRQNHLHPPAGRLSSAPNLNGGPTWIEA